MKAEYDAEGFKEGMGEQEWEDQFDEIVRNFCGMAGVSDDRYADIAAAIYEARNEGESHETMARRIQRMIQ